MGIHSDEHSHMHKCSCKEKKHRDARGDAHVVRDTHP